MMDYLTQAFANLHQMEASRFYVWAVFIAINNVVLLSWISASVLHRESYHATKFSRVWSVVEASLVLFFAIATAADTQSMTATFVVIATTIVILLVLRFSVNTIHYCIDRIRYSGYDFYQ